MKTLRVNADITQEDLAHESGVDRGYVGKIDRGENLPSIKTLYRLFPPLRISFVEFAGEYEKALKRCRRYHNHHLNRAP